MPDNTIDVTAQLETPAGSVSYHSLAALEEQGLASVELVPSTVKILLENLLRSLGAEVASDDDVEALARWGRSELQPREMPFSPARVILQDFTGVPAVVDLAAMRSAIQQAGGEASKGDPPFPGHLGIEQSVEIGPFA